MEIIHNSVFNSFKQQDLFFLWRKYINILDDNRETTQDEYNYR